MTAVGILNPGAMGASIAASARAAGHDVIWASTGRSAATRQRAAENDLREVDSLAQLCAACDIILCVCPPHAAETVAEAVIAAGFGGLYCEGNAISPQKATSIAERMGVAGIDFVDGSIVGPPAWQADTTRFYLSGPSAGQVAALFAGTLTEAIAIGAEVGKASALKMTFAALTKGSTALLSAIYGTAENLGVRDELEREWAMRSAEAVEQRRNQVRGVTSKAWRFAGEMQEIAATFELAGLPPGFFKAAFEVYTRLAGFKDAEDAPELDDILASLTTGSD